jgi:hypothetical protein
MTDEEAEKMLDDLIAKGTKPPEDPKSAERTNQTAHDVLQEIYQNPDNPASVRLRAATAALSCETPKLAAIVVAHPRGDFADQLHAARMAGKRQLTEAKVIEHEPALVSAEAVIGPTTRDVNYNAPFAPLRRF